MKRLFKLVVVVLSISLCLSLFSFSAGAEDTVETYEYYYKGEYNSGVHQGNTYIFFGKVSNVTSEYGIIITNEENEQRVFKGKAIGEEGKFGIAIYNLPDGVYTVKAYSGEENARIYGETVTVEKGEVYIREGKTVYFGSYPQTEVTDSTLISTLNSLAGALPTSEDSQNWMSYGYYINEKIENYTWYVDISLGAEKYRGVYFTKYRPKHIVYDSASSSMLYQYDNGYFTGTVYWFKYEPIKWTILDESTGLMLCDMIIDSQEYYINETARTINGETIYPNNYEYSTIRTWLNDTFLNTAFTARQKNIIKTTTVDNSARSTNPNNNARYRNSGKNQYACNDTQDKVFIPSVQEITNTAYGFNKSVNNYDTARRKKSTDYAQSQGCDTSSSGSYSGNGHWRVRSPYYDGDISSWYVRYNGDNDWYCRVCNTSIGTVPALRLQLD